MVSIGTIWNVTKAGAKLVPWRKVGGALATVGAFALTQVASYFADKEQERQIEKMIDKKLEERSNPVTENQEEVDA